MISIPNFFKNAKKDKKTEEEDISVGRSSYVASNKRSIRQTTQITYNILQEIEQAQDTFSAINTIVDKVPDGKMALNIYTTFTNTGGQFKFHNLKTGKRAKKSIEEEFKVFCERVGRNNGSGLDGIMDALTRSAYVDTGMAFEIIVMDDLSDIQDIAVIDPSTFGDWEWIEAEQRYAVYQKRDDNKKIDLYEGNFFWFPYQPKAGSPLGTFKFEPAIQAVTNYYQLISDGSTILNRVAYMRYLATLDEKAVLEGASPNEKDTIKKRHKLMQDAYNSVGEQLASAGRDSDLITSTSNKIDTLGGGINGSGIDMRAFLEFNDPLICNAFNLELVMLNRQNGGSYALGTAQYKAFVDSLEGASKDLTRARETIANMWARIKGYSVIATFEPKPLEWQKEIDKWQAKLKEVEFTRRLQEYAYIDADTATNNMTGNDKAISDTKGLYEFLRAVRSETETENNTEKEQTNKTLKGGEKDAEKDNK